MADVFTLSVSYSQGGTAWYENVRAVQTNKAVLGVVLSLLSLGRIHKQASNPDVGSFDELKKELDSLVESFAQAEFTALKEVVNNDQQLQVISPDSGLLHMISPDVSGLSNLVCASLRLAIKDKNPKLVGLILKLVLLLVDKRQIYPKKNEEKKTVFESGLLEGSINACCKGEVLTDSCYRDGATGKELTEVTGLNENQSSSQEKEAAEVCLGPGLESLFSYVSNLLPEILPVTSGFSQQAIEFLRSKNLFVPYDGFDLKHLDYEEDDFKVTSATTTISSSSVICAVSDSMATGRSFDHVWMPLSAYRLIASPLNQIDYDELTGIEGAFYLIGMSFAIFLVLVSALVGMALYPVVLMYVYSVHGFNVYNHAASQLSAAPMQGESKSAVSKSGAENGGGSQESLSHAAISGPQPSASGPESTCCSSKSTWKVITAFLSRPLISFIKKSLEGNQSVAGHVLCLTGVGSLKSLKMLLTAPIDVFETPAVRAAVEGAWSRFVFGFYVRFALFVVQLLLFSAFASWCIAQDISYSTMDTSQDTIIKASFTGGCVAAGIGAYFMMREILECCSCVADEGLKDYIEFWNVVQVCSHSLELASFAMFVSGSDPVNTRLVATYAVFSLWINLLYFTKAIRQISFLLEILTTIITDMIPFVFIMTILVLADTLALLVLVGNLKDADNEVLFTSFATPLDLVYRMAEGRQDLGGSSLESLAKEVLKQANIGIDAQNAISCTIYLCCYFLFFMITIVALNALIALMGSSYEKVMEKKISQRLQPV
jgi:hypothetical protein